MCRKRGAEKGCGGSMGLSLTVLYTVLCVYQPWVALAAPLNVAVSTGDGNQYINSNQTVTSSTPDQSNGVDASEGVMVQTTSKRPFVDVSVSAIHLTTTNAKKLSTDIKYTPGAVSSAVKSPSTTTTENESVLSETTPTRTVLSTASGAASRIYSTVPDRTSSWNRKTASSAIITGSSSVPTTTTVGVASSSFTAVLNSGVTSVPTTKTYPVTTTTTSPPPPTTTSPPPPTTSPPPPTTTTTSKIVNPQLVTGQGGTTGIGMTSRDTTVTAEARTAMVTSQTSGEPTTETSPPVTVRTNATTMRATSTTNGSSDGDSTKTTIGTVVDAITFEVVDPQKYTFPPKTVANSTSSPTPLGAGATVSPENTTTDSMAGAGTSSRDDISIYMGFTTDKGNTSLRQTAALNTTALYTSIKGNITAVTNSSIYITSTMKVESSTTSAASTNTAVSNATSSTTTETANTTVSVIKTPTKAPPSDIDPSGKGAESDQKPVDQGSLTTILLVLCASLLVLLLTLCVFTYVKFRKKSRSIRKRLTFKDDSIYDNPIYHGRWEVPKAPEPTSSSCPRSLPMLISALPDEVSRLSKDEDTGFRLQFMMLDKLSPNSPRQAATTDMNTHKNRYRDILPFDHNRVKLAEEGDLSDYINASYVPGVKSEREYVASQGPLERTAADHWRMIWELNIRIIAMLTTCEEGDLIFKAKCCQYWPNKENESVNYGGIYVTLVSTTRLCRDNYKLKVLHIRKGKDAEPRKVQLFQYIKWPDRKNPEDPEAFLEYRDHVRREMDAFDEQSPLLVHCSAGVGRTGTFIAIDTLLQHMEERESLDVYGLVLRLRKYRVLLVQNANQYKFVHMSLLIKLDKMKKAEVDEGQKKAGIDGSYPYENMVMGQRAVVGELGGLVHGGDNSGAPTQQSSAVQSFLRKTKTNVQPDMATDDPQCRNSDGMPSPVKIEEWPRPLSDPVPRPVVETPKSKPFSGNTLGDPERALAKELGGMFQGGVERHASPGKTAAIKAFLRNRDLEGESAPSNSQSNPNGDSLVIDNRFREETEKQTTCL